MTEARTAAVLLIPEAGIEVVALAERPAGKGPALIVQFPLGQEQPTDPVASEDDPDDDDAWGYCISNHLGATYYGGMESVALNPARHLVVFHLTEEAATVLTVPRICQFTLDVPREHELTFYEAVERRFTQYAIPVTVGQ